MVLPNLYGGWQNKTCTWLRTFCMRWMWRTYWQVSILRHKNKTRWSTTPFRRLIPPGAGLWISVADKYVIVLFVLPTFSWIFNKNVLIKTVTEKSFFKKQAKCYRYWTNESWIDNLSKMMTTFWKWIIRNKMTNRLWELVLEKWLKFRDIGVIQIPENISKSDLDFLHPSLVLDNRKRFQNYTQLNLNLLIGISSNAVSYHMAHMI